VRVVNAFKKPVVTHTQPRRLPIVPNHVPAVDIIQADEHRLIELVPPMRSTLLQNSCRSVAPRKFRCFCTATKMTISPQVRSKMSRAASWDAVACACLTRSMCIVCVACASLSSQLAQQSPQQALTGCTPPSSQHGAAHTHSALGLPSMQRRLTSHQSLLTCECIPLAAEGARKLGA
jgi:hypothetical protein